MHQGGTELAFMSTTSSLKVAVSRCRLCAEEERTRDWPCTWRDGQDPFSKLRLLARTRGSWTWSLLRVWLFLVSN